MLMEKCTWHGDVRQCLAFVGFVSCEEDFSLPESCPTWLCVTRLCFEDRRVSTGWPTALMNKEQSESENHRPTPILGKFWIISDVFVPFELQAYWFRHLYKGEKSLIIKVDSNTSLCCSKQESAQSSLPMHHRYVLSEKGWLDTRLLQWLDWADQWDI